MKTQHYKMKASTENLELAKSGQIVFANNESDDIVGFIDFVSDCEICIMLFDPTDSITEDQIHIAETCDWVSRLKEIMADDPYMEDMWVQLI